MNPDVSVIVPVYNVESYLPQCLDSLVGQTLREIEIVCVDDGSTDGSPTILAAYAAKDARIKVLTRPHANAGAARNAGLAVATGDYLAFVDADDFCDVTLYEKAYARARETNADLVTWRFDQYDARAGGITATRVFPQRMLELGSPYSPEALGELLFTPLNYAPWTRLVRRKRIVGDKIRFQEIIRTNDVMFACLALATSRKQVLLDEVLYHYRTGRAGNLQSGNAETPTLVVDVWQAVAAELKNRGLWEKYGEHLTLPAANSLFYTLHTIDRLESARSLFESLRKLYGADGAFGSVTAQQFLRNRQTKFFYETLMKSQSVEDYLLRQVVYHRRRLAESWCEGQSLGKQLAQEKSEHAAKLKEVQANLAAAEKKTEEIQAKADEMARQNGTLRAQLAHRQNELEDAAARLTRMESQNADLRQDHEALAGQLARLEGRRRQLVERVTAFQQTRAYRIGARLHLLPREILSAEE